MHNLQLYFRLKGLSYYRILREFPLIYLFLIAASVCAAIYGLTQIHVAFSAPNTAICLIVFIAICQQFFRISHAEKILLKSLHINILTIYIVEYVMASLLFLLLNIPIGLITIAVGVIFAFIQSKEKTRTNKKIYAFYKNTSYQWLSSFRQEGVWISFVCFFFFVVALYHENDNMLKVAFGSLICIPCYFAYYKIPDNKAWLRIYKSSAFLMRSKLIELIINTVVPTTVYLLTAIVFRPEDPLSFALLALSLLGVNMLFFYCYYVCYPSILMSLVCFICLLSACAVLAVIYPEIVVFASCLLFCILHIIAIQNINATLYVTPEA